MDNKLKTYKDYIYMLFGKDSETEILDIEPEQMFNPKWILENSIYETSHKCAELALCFISQEYHQGRTSFYMNIYYLMKECLKVLNKYLRTASSEEKETADYIRTKENVKHFKKMFKEITISKSTYCIYRIVEEDDNCNETVIYESPEMIDEFGPNQFHPEREPIFNYNEHFYNLLLDYAHKYNYSDWETAPAHTEYTYSTYDGKRTHCCSMIEHYYNL